MHFLTEDFELPFLCLILLKHFFLLNSVFFLAIYTLLIYIFICVKNNIVKNLFDWLTVD